MLHGVPSHLAPSPLTFYILFFQLFLFRDGGKRKGFNEFVSKKETVKKEKEKEHSFKHAHGLYSGLFLSG